MKTIWFTAPRTVELLDEERPKAGPNELVVQVHVTGISVGTEMGLYRGSEMRLSRAEYTFPIRPGYEAVGTVVERGAEVTAFGVGDRVLCLGGHSQYVKTDPALTVPLPDHLGDEQATLAVLATTAQNGIRRAKIEFGDTVAVIGLGVVGLLAAQEARLAGAGRVIGIDINPFRLEVARKLGIEYLVDASKDDPAARVTAITGLGADEVIEAAGNAKAFEQALMLPRERGRVVILGYHVHPVQFVPGEEFWAKELDVFAARAGGPPMGLPEAYTRWTMDRSLRYSVDLIASGRLRVDGMITHRFAYTEAAPAYAMVDQGQDNFVQVLLLWT
jgi:2-desacetyl-2-hydroxyethyl bacteriochlorophyllide A dehydrogenase